MQKACRGAQEGLQQQGIAKLKMKKQREDASEALQVFALYRTGLIEPLVEILQGALVVAAAEANTTILI